MARQMMSFEQALQQSGLPANLVPVARSIYAQESASGRNKQAMSMEQNYASARGPMQVIDSTFRGMQRAGVIPKDWDLKNPEHNMMAGIAYVKSLGEQFGNDPAKVAASYYSGPGVVAADGSIKAFRDPKNPDAPNTHQYVQQVLRRAARMEGGESVAAGGDVQQPKAKPWSAVVANPEFQRLPFEVQNQAREKYFEDVVMPRIKPDEVARYRQAFDADTAPLPIPGSSEARYLTDAAAKRVAITYMRNAAAAGDDMSAINALGGRIKTMGGRDLLRAMVTGQDTRAAAQKATDELTGARESYADQPGTFREAVTGVKQGAPLVDQVQGALGNLANPAGMVGRVTRRVVDPLVDVMSSQQGLAGYGGETKRNAAALAQIGARASPLLMATGQRDAAIRQADQFANESVEQAAQLGRTSDVAGAGAAVASGVNTMPFAMVQAPAAGASLRTLAGAAGGLGAAQMVAATPVAMRADDNEADFGAAKVGQGLIGAALGAGIPLVAGAVGRGVGSARNIMQNRWANAEAQRLESLAGDNNLKTTLGDLMAVRDQAGRRDSSFTGGLVRGAEDLLSNIGWSGRQGRLQDQADTVTKGFENLAESAVGTGRTGGDAIISGLKETFNANKAAAGAKFDSIDALAGNDRVAVGNFLPALKDVFEKFPQLLGSSRVQNAQNRKLLTRLANGQVSDLSFSEARAIRSELGAMVGDLSKPDAPGLLGPQAKRLFAGLASDLDQWGAQNTAKGAAYREALDDYKSKVVPFYDGPLSKVIGGKVDTDTVIDAFLKNNRGAMLDDTNRLAPPEVKEALQAALLRRAADARESASGNVTDATLQTLVNRRLGSTADAVLTPAQSKRLSALTELSGLTDRAGRMNNSTTGRSVAITSGWGAPISAGLVAGSALGNPVAGALVGMAVPAASRGLRALLESDIAKRAIMSQAGNMAPAFRATMQPARVLEAQAVTQAGQPDIEGGY